MAKFLDEILAKLHAAEGLAGWQVRETESDSDQLFLNKDRTESRRQVHSLAYHVEILVDHPSASGSPATGNSRFSVDPGSLGRFEADLARAQFAAALVDNEPYRMPDPGLPVARLELCDPVLKSEGAKALDGLGQRLRQAAGREEGVRLTAAEFFSNQVKSRLLNSQGLQAAQETTLLEGEAVLLARREGGESEVFKAFSRRRLEDLKLEAEVGRWAESGRSRAKAGLPQTGSFDVVFSGEALDHLFDWFGTQASAQAKYNRVVQNEPDQWLAQPGPGATPLVLWHNAQIPWAVGSYRFDSSGLPATRRLLVHQGRLVTYWAGSRYAQYLKLKPSGDLANLEVDPGTESSAELLKPSEGRPLYHLHEFSYFAPNDITGEFSAEIRAGEEITAQGSRPVKGGSVSGSSAKAIGGARFSSQREQREHYLGPGHVRCPGLTIAGD
jgi:predicted Zn-dependent protease